MAWTREVSRFSGRTALQCDILLPTETLRKADSQSPFSFLLLKVIPTLLGEHNFPLFVPLKNLALIGVQCKFEKGFWGCGLGLGFAFNMGTGGMVG